jgi:hypothetical protein
MGNKVEDWDNRWEAAGSFAKWFHMKMTQAGLKPDQPFVYVRQRDNKKFVVDAESIVSVIVAAGKNPDYQQAIYDLIMANERRGRPLRDVIEQAGAKFVASGFFERDPNTKIQNFPVN